MTCHPAYAKTCGHAGWCACIRHRRNDAVQPVGQAPRYEETDPLYRPHRSRSAITVGDESPLRRLDRPNLDIGQDERVVVRGHYALGPGTTRGPITSDNEGIWWVAFDTGREDSFDYHLLERVYEL